MSTPDFMQSLRASTLVVQPREFLDALNKAWRPLHHEKTQKLGLALSGGVDSMALAYLCRTLASWAELYDIGLSYEAFIVDHKAREGSTEEAKIVSERLEKLLAVKPRILTLTWAPGIWPSKLANFESQARRLRFQVLGTACRQHNVQALLLAHHADDQAETVLTRLAQGHKDMGLRGIQPSAQIPECWGIFGVNQSGRSTSHDGRERRCARQSPNIKIESGGVTIHRPLLEFPKARLIATCQAAGVEWVEDATNHDPTITSRNAARSLLNTSRLPMALQAPSLLALACKKQEMVQSWEAYADRFAELCRFVAFDPRQGSLVVYIPPDVMTTVLSTFGESQDLAVLQSGARVFVRRLVEKVSPRRSLSLNDVDSAAETLLQFSGSTPSRHIEEDVNSVTIVVGGVMIRSRMPEPEYHPNQGQDSRNVEVNPPDPSSGVIWRLTRQPYCRNEKPILSIPPLSFPKPHHETIHRHSQILQPQDLFNLWDGRYWIRLMNRTEHQLQIRPLEKSDWKSFCSILGRQKRRLIRLSNEVAPGDEKWTLPAIALSDESGQGQVLALPSLGIVLDEWKGKFNWYLRFKSVDLRDENQDKILGQDLRAGVGYIGKNVGNRQ